jgi:hypothetical protein
MQETPGREPSRLPTGYPPHPWLCPPPMPPHACVFRHRPPRQWPVKVLESRGQGRLVVAGVVGEPAADKGIEHPRQIVERLVHPTPQLPLPNRAADRLRRGVTHARAEVDAVLPPPILRPPWPTRVTQEVNVRFGVSPSSVVVLAVDARCLLGMQCQSTVGQAARQSRP